jgi:hypothetical protein
MSKRKPKPDLITDLPEGPKHHVPQQLARVEVIRGRVLRLMRGSLANVRSLMAAMGGNEQAVENLRGKSGDAILARCCDFVMMELGDTASAEETGGGRSRAFSRKVKGSMGLASDDVDSESESQTAA